MPGSRPARPHATSPVDDVEVQQRIETMTEFDPKMHLNQRLPTAEEDVPVAANLLAEKLATGGRLTGCTSYLQRKMPTSYTHAAAILDAMVVRGVITEADDRGERRFIGKP
jgi:DNA segregation ATPase FtsK/SpoIIIE-like protein